MNKQSAIPKISIVTPSFNHGKFLEQTIDSILSQNYPNLEYIIIDGGSNDNSVNIIKKYEKFLKYWCSEKDDGHYAAVNKGFQLATGDIFAWLNSDDMYCQDAFTTVASIFTAYPQVSWISALHQVVWDVQGRCKKVRYIPGFSKEIFLDGHSFTKKYSGMGFIQQESTFWRRQLWHKAGGLRTQFKLAGDFDLWARFYQHEELYGITHKLGGFRFHGANRSLQSDDYTKEAELSLREMRIREKWPRSLASTTLWGTLRWRSFFRYFLQRVQPMAHKSYETSIITQNQQDTNDQWFIKRIQV